MGRGDLGTPDPNHLFGSSIGHQHHSLFLSFVDKNVKTKLILYPK